MPAAIIAWLIAHQLALAACATGLAVATGAADVVLKGIEIERALEPRPAVSSRTEPAAYAVPVVDVQTASD